MARRSGRCGGSRSVLSLAASAVTRILIRCDVTVNWQWPIRCRNPARDLQKRGAEVIFLCRRQPGDLIGLLENEFVVLALPEQVLFLAKVLKVVIFMRPGLL